MNYELDITYDNAHDKAMSLLGYWIHETYRNDRGKLTNRFNFIFLKERLN